MAQPLIPMDVQVSSDLIDFGVLPVGDLASREIEFSSASAGGTLRIERVAVTNVEGVWFEGDTDVPVEVGPRDPIARFVVQYHPAEIGYHWGTLEIHHGADSPTVVNLRGRAVLPEVTIAPLHLDFGQVDPGSSASRTVTIFNRSDLDMTVSDYNVSNSVFDLLNALPVTIPPGNLLGLGVLFSPIDASPQVGTLTLSAGAVDFPQIALRGNDCENGDPVDYDTDSDGVTSCGGDCDDSSAAVRPGANEIANQLDDDCDGDRDEDTDWADDDGDGYCEDPAFCSDGSRPGDCADSSDPGADTDRLNPGETEIPGNGIDDDCDGTVQ